MAFEVKIEKLAKAELEEALAWYGLQMDGLDQLLLDSVSEAIELLSLRPLAQPGFLNLYRKLVMKRFPYILVFHVDEPNNLVTILSFWHTSRDPDLLSDNLKLYE